MVLKVENEYGWSAVYKILGLSLCNNRLSNSKYRNCCIEINLSALKLWSKFIKTKIVTILIDSVVIDK